MHQRLNELFELNLVHRVDGWSLYKGGFIAGLWHDCETIDNLPSRFSTVESELCSGCGKPVPNVIKKTAILIRE